MAKTYKDIQSLTELSLSTISKYFNGGTLKPANQKKIERAIDKLDYRVNPFAQGLKSRRSRRVGVMIPELSSSFHTTIMAEVCSLLRKANYESVVVDCNLDKNVEKDALRSLLDKMVDGIITIPLNQRGNHLKLAQERGVPVVLIDRLTTEFKTDAVIVDNFGAGALAARELIAHGHTRIGLIAGLREVFTMRKRADGFLSALEAASIPHEEKHTVHVEFNVDGGYHAAHSLLALNNPPTALLTVNYELTLGTIIALNELGLRMGSDISVVGFDNLQLARIVKPQMTMVVQPMHEIAVQASSLMIERLEQPEQPGVHILELPTELIRGASVVDLVGMQK